MADFRASEADLDAPRAKKQKTNGFKWKDKKTSTDTSSRDQPNAGLQRGYRDRSPRHHSYRDRSPHRDGSRERSPRRRHDRDAAQYDNDRARDRRREDADDRRSYNRTDRERGRHDREHDRYRERSPAERMSKDSQLKEVDKPDKYSSSTAEKFGLSTSKVDRKDKPKKQPKITAPSEPMIIVNINDRLGTKAAIPCLASDSVKAFKAIVAAHIGRQPHEIMLKRQGERPFKDQLSLEDYGVSNGVQLDLEIDTGD